MIYVKDLTLKEYFIWICCVNIFQITLQANNCMKCLRKMSANQSAKKKTGPITLIGPGPTVILLIGPLIQIVSLLLGRADGMLQGI